jgi:gliding motility-associated-like protein
LGQSTQLYATDALNYSYQWWPDTSLSTLLTFDPIAQPRNTTTYYLNVVNEFGCLTTDSIIIIIKAPICDLPVVFVPSAFSPDGDGYNDILYINGNNIIDLNFAIYNRWGQKVFESNDQSIGWDGTFKGESLAPDVFGYYMQCTCDDGSQQFVKGNITLLK